MEETTITTIRKRMRKDNEKMFHQEQHEQQQYKLQVERK